MSKMKHLLRKLHIGGGFNDHHHHRMSPEASPLIDRPLTQAEPLTPSSAASTSMQSVPELATTTAVDSVDNSVDLNFFEEEFQMQLALAISVSDPDAREDPETAQIKAAKQISLGRVPSETLVESLSLQYWSYNFLTYDEKVMDGFYDIYGIASNSAMQGKIPLLADLQAISVSDDVGYEVIVVNRAIDPALKQLEERVHVISAECGVFEQGPMVCDVIQKIADLVVHRLGGPVCDADEMLKRWTCRSYELRNSLNSIVLPLGHLNVGLSRHRALLFKVLADRINLPCMLVKGSYYTGTDEGAVNLVKFDNGSEYIIDLMGAPGTLIPAEVPSDHLQNSGIDTRSRADDAETAEDSCREMEKGIGTLTISPDLGPVSKGGGSNSVQESFPGNNSKGTGKKLEEVNQTHRFESDFSKLLPSLCRSHDSASGTGGKASDERKSKVKDVSKYVISAAKNPEFAQKLHAVLLENVASPPPHLFLDITPHDLREIKILENTNLLNGERVNDVAQTFPDILVTSTEQSHVPSTGVQSFNDFQQSRKQKHLAGNMVSENMELASTEGFLLVNCGTLELNRTDDVGFTLVPVGPSGMVVTSVHTDQPHEPSIPSATNYYQGPCKLIVTGDGERYGNDKVGKVLDNIEREKESAVRLTETANSSLPVACDAQGERIKPVLGYGSDWEIQWEDLQIGERIGIGSYGEVYRADWNGTEVAVKKFMDQDISGDALAQFKCEVEIMLRLRHPNVVLFMGAVTHPPNLSILTEYLPRGSLYKLLHRPNNQLDEKKRMRMAVDVAKGMNYLHTSHTTIVHRDLKTPNLLVDKNWVVKVCDFGLSRLKHHTFLSSKSTAGTPEWMAPEVLRNEPSNEKCDVYSFGVILWELATLRVPWTGMNSMQVVGAVGFQNRHLDITEEIDPTVAQIILDCWHRDPQLRPSFGQLISSLRRLQCLQRPVLQITQTHSD